MFRPVTLNAILDITVQDTPTMRLLSRYVADITILVEPTTEVRRGALAGFCLPEA